MARPQLRKTLIVIGLGALLGLGLLRMTAGERIDNSPVERFAQAVLAPIQMGFSYGTQSLGGLGQSVLNYKQVTEENEALHTEKGELQRQVSLLKQYQLENIRLKELLGFKEEKEQQYDLVSARVIARDPSTWFSTLTLDRGSRDGIARNMVIINNDGLIGHVVSVTPFSSQVLLIIDREGPVPGLIEVTREPGIVEARADGSGLLQMINLRRDGLVQEGQLVLTSGLGAIYPKGLKIGYVLDILPEPNGLTKRATIRPAVDFQRLEEVFIIRNVYKEEGAED
ncbi:rod shape-determining protein MreC [Heliorestis acidaminivorans]|uniref:Cell shape-determining protein MreC n=1 Tax=Heliorestis acidaminivorans TaxID=553427 RepID=A0A6I0EZG8_9FIRM|nr:rod shape-determining protein MreC [Heliorestis acidaminivorans]KAB2952339.1 rod shape-determining protein MreC [Heliorestis acidaminivorans]